MLIYVRESEREEIMADGLSIDEQIPKELRNFFEREEEFRHQIEKDKQHFQKLRDCYMITPQILEWFQWRDLSLQG